jgi:hypothetical protein
MKTRMMSARCCCGPGPSPTCDPINGYFDVFDTFSSVPAQFPLVTGRWNLTQEPGTLVTASSGKVRIDHSGLSVPQTGNTILERCAIWDTFEHGGSWPTTSGIQLRLNYQWSNGNYSLDGQLFESLGAYPDIAELYYDLLSGAFRQRSFVRARLAYTTGVGWRHRFEFVDASSSPVVSVAATTAVFSTSRFLPLNSTFSHSLVMAVAPLPSQIWFAQVTLDGTQLMSYPATSMAKPVNGVGEATYITGFRALSAVEWLEADEWKYL